MLKVRIIKSEYCDQCRDYLANLARIKDAIPFEYEIFDADDKNNRQQLDEWKVTDMPVIQIIDRDRDKVSVLEQISPPGGVAVRILVRLLKMHDTGTR